MVPFGWDLRVNSLPLFLSVLLEKLNAKERQALIKAAALTKAEVGAWQKLEAAAKKLERELKSPKLQKPSQLYQGYCEDAGRAGSVPGWCTRRSGSCRIASAIISRNICRPRRRSPMKWWRRRASRRERRNSSRPRKR